MHTVRQWLDQLGLAQYAEVLAENDVDLEALRLLTESDLEKLGVSLGHRKKLLKAISELARGLALAPAAAPIQARPPTEGERRQLTVLFCDMVGFTELANRVDPEVLQRIIRSYEDACAVCITRYEGYVFQRLGDGIVAFFGYPLAHEGEAERAIHAGLEIIQALSKVDIPDAGHLAVRIGIATGLVVVSSAETGAAGETMNLASRLQGIAQPGSIVVSERVHRLAGGRFDYADLGEQTLKGIAKPTHAYRILRVSEATTRFEAAHAETGLTPLVGREQELGLLLERWQLAQDGEGQVVLLSGEPGIGKSRILSALRERLETQGAQALKFQCSPYYINSAFWPSIDNFERALKFGRDESPESKLDKLEALIVTRYGQPLADVRFVASMLSIPCEARYGALAMTPQKHKDETLRTLVDLTEAAARKQPSVMLFEDTHWADPTTLEVLDLLIDRVKSFPLLIVLTHRPEFQSKWGSHGHVTALNLSKLTRVQCSAMVSKLAGGKALPAESLEQILLRTDGVPLFVEELTKAILESGELRDAGDHYDYTGAARTITIPATLRDSMMARLDRFLPVKEIAQIGAAIGREFSYELIAAVAPHTKTELDSALNQLTESGLAFRRGNPPEATYTFKHALVQDAAYDSLLKSRRQELHTKIARVIEKDFPKTKDTEPEVLAHHFTEAHMPEPAIACWSAAAKVAIKRFAHREAVAHLDIALKLLDTLLPTPHRDEQELELRLALANTYIATKGYSASETEVAYEKAQEVADRLGDVPQIFPISYGRWVFQLVTGQTTKCHDTARGFFRRAENSSDTLVRSVAGRVLGSAALITGNPAHARRLLGEAASLYDPDHHRESGLRYGQDGRVAALGNDALAHWYLGFCDQARSRSTEAIAWARPLNHYQSLGYALFFATNLGCLSRDAVAVRTHGEEANALAQQHGAKAHEIWFRAYLAWIPVESGDGAEATQGLEAAIVACAELHIAMHSPWFYTWLATAYGNRGMPDKGIEVARKAVSLVEERGERIHHAEVLRVYGTLERIRGDAAAAESRFEEALVIAKAQQAKSWELRTATSLARLWQSQGKHKEAHDLLAPIYGWFTEGFDTKDLKEAKALLDEFKL